MIWWTGVFAICLWGFKLARFIASELARSDRDRAGYSGYYKQEEL